MLSPLFKGSDWVEAPVRHVVSLVRIGLWFAGGGVYVKKMHRTWFYWLLRFQRGAMLQDWPIWTEDIAVRNDDGALSRGKLITHSDALTHFAVLLLLFLVSSLTKCQVITANTAEKKFWRWYFWTVGQMSLLRTRRLTTTAWYNRSSDSRYVISNGFINTFTELCFVEFGVTSSLWCRPLFVLVNKALAIIWDQANAFQNKWNALDLLWFFFPLRDVFFFFFFW